MTSKKESILVIGGGISGMTTAIEAAEVGREVFLVETDPYLGGRVARMNKYFPKLCPPWCGLEINLRRIRQNPKIHVFTYTDVTSIDGEVGGYRATLMERPRMVTEACTSCGDCTPACPVERDDDFNYGMARTKAIYLPFMMAHPQRYVIDEAACPGEECGKCVEACKYEAIDLAMKTRETKIEVGKVVFATGWQPYEAEKIDNLGFGKLENVVTNVMMERLAAREGPTGGKILRPSDGKEITSIAFVQCAGSRDENHLPYCSTVCCMASLKQATYVREAHPEASAEIFYIDLRTPGRHEDFLKAREKDEKLTLTKGKVAEITEDPSTKNLTVVAEDVQGGSLVRREVDMVVLATGMVPNGVARELISTVETDDNGFVASDEKIGVIAAGVTTGPMDVSTSVQQGTAAALKAMISE
ncbi:MAG: CoB--CoM heterodisulfide reductase iron-sulfur subunit A family protein [Deltaproteobacteria bacterium]|nr:CoB--CoM heterodisulfide reductase iron-sulfur subunit A family protein [Deltaproteobacteria bacterium]